MTAKLQRLARRLLRSVRSFQADNFLDLSATVAFYTLLSLGPLVFLVGRTLRRLFDGSTAPEQAVDRVSLFLPENVANVVTGLPLDTGVGDRLVWIAVPALIWVGTSAFSSLEFAINVAFGTSPGRRNWRSRLRGMGILGGGWAVLIGSLVTTSLLLPRLWEVKQNLGLPSAPRRLAEFGSYLLPVVVTYLALLLFFKTLPRCRVRWAPAAAGALLALVLWEAARQVFGSVLGRSPSFGLLTGALAGIVAFLLWVYTAVAIVLLGAEFAGQLNGTRPSVREGSTGPA